MKEIVSGFPGRSAELSVNFILEGSVQQIDVFSKTWPGMNGSG